MTTGHLQPSHRIDRSRPPDTPLTGCDSGCRGDGGVDDWGMATIELLIWAPIVVVLILAGIYAGRVTIASNQVGDAAHQAARAATLARDPTAATAAARETAQTALARSGAGCRTPTVHTDVGDLTPGATVTVTITCVVDLSDLTLLPVPGQTEITDTFSAVIDVHRAPPPARADSLLHTNGMTRGAP